MSDKTTEPLASQTKQATTLKSHIARHGFVQIPPLHTSADIKLFNQAFDDIFASQKSPRRYVDSAQMLKAGVFEQLFNPQLQQLIYAMQNDAVLYHCHAYEIDANQTKPHILADNLADGWHRDWDCPLDLTLDSDVQQISLFVYLTDVGDNDGGFEICDKAFTPLPNRLNNANFYQIQGTKGHTFMFNRIAYHRASPNLSSTARRVIKLSFQAKTDFNSRIKLEQFEYLRQHLPQQQVFLRQLAGDNNIDVAQTTAFMTQLTDSFIIEHLPNPTPIKINLSFAQQWHTYLRQLRYYINLKRGRVYQGY